MTNAASYLADVVIYSTDLDSEDFDGVNGARRPHRPDQEHRTGIAG